MSQYTTQVRFIVEMNSDPGQPITKRCEQAAPSIFTDEWPFYDESKRLKFETDFLRHFYVSEIGCETVELWKLFLNDWLITNMPYYNARLAAVAKEFNFLDTYDYSETGENGLEEDVGRSTNTTSNTTQNDEGSGNTFTKEYDFPSNAISNISDHMTSGNQTDSSASNTSEQNSSSDTDEKSNRKQYGKNTVTRKGRIGSPSDELEKYLKAVKNVQAEIFDAMRVLFFGLW